MLESMLELLMAKFENLRMSEEETINDFNGRLCDIVVCPWGKDFRRKTCQKGPKILALKVCDRREACM